MTDEFEKLCPISGDVCNSDKCAWSTYGNPTFPCGIKEYLYLNWCCQEEIKDKLDTLIQKIANIESKLN